MTYQAFYGSLKSMPFLKSYFRFKVTLNGRKQDYTKYISTQLTPQESKKKKKRLESPDLRRAYICPSDRTAGQMRNPLGYRGTP